MTDWVPTGTPEDGLADRPAAVLTTRHREVAALVARGWTNEQIATELALTRGTVANHVAAILDRLGLRSRSEITAWAIEHGLAAAQDRLLTILERLLEIQASSLKGAMDAASQLLAEALGSDKADAFLYDPASDTLVAIGTSDTPMGRKQHALGLHLVPVTNGGRAVEVFRTGVPRLDGRVDRDPEELDGIKHGLGVRSALCVPLDVVGERRGVLSVVSARADLFSERDRWFLEAVSRWVGSVAHRAELTEQLAAAAVEQGRRAAAEELITVLAHDLRNHLTPLRGRIGLLRRRAARENRSVDLADAAEAAASLARLERLIADLLDAGRLEQGLFAVSPQAIDLVVLARETAEALGAAGTEIRVRTPAEVIVQADPDRLRQALENLVGNAIQHSPEGAAVVLDVTMLTREEGRRAVITVADEGPGIPPELLPHLFERFAPGPDSTGLGLGLYLASRIAAAHGGALTVDSAPGHGARFVLTLPAGDAAQSGESREP